MRFDVFEAAFVPHKVFCLDQSVLALQLLPLVPRVLIFAEAALVAPLVLHSLAGDDLCALSRLTQLRLGFNSGLPVIILKADPDPVSAPIASHITLLGDPCISHGVKGAVSLGLERSHSLLSFPRSLPQLAGSIMVHFPVVWLH